MNRQRKARPRKRCDGVARRDFLRVGTLGSMGAGLGLADLLNAEAAAGTGSSEKAAILVYLDGGQSHLESWDLKPDAGETAGEFKPIATNVDGIQVCEHMPHLARHADKYCVLRGVEGAIGVHGIGMQYVRTGNRPVPSLTYPDIASVMAKEYTAPKGIPPYVSLPISRTNQTIETPGYLGVAFGSFGVNGDPNAEDFSVRALRPPGGMSEQRQFSRRTLTAQLDGAFREHDLANSNLEGMNRFYAQAWDILRSEKIRQAFELEREKSTMRDFYGRTSIGQGLLLARRLVEAGVRCITLDFGGWDTHKDNFNILKDKLLPPWDQGMAALLSDLQDRGLLDTTLVWSTGEMGRTPTINKDAGRDHWGTAMSMMLAGGGIRGGQVIGATDKTGAAVIEEPCTPADVTASALHALGIRHTKEYHTPTGRPVMIVREGEVIEKMFAG